MGFPFLSSLLPSSMNIFPLPFSRISPRKPSFPLQKVNFLYHLVSWACSGSLTLTSSSFTRNVFRVNVVLAPKRSWWMEYSPSFSVYHTQDQTVCLNCYMICKISNWKKTPALGPVFPHYLPKGRPQPIILPVAFTLIKLCPEKSEKT